MVIGIKPSGFFKESRIISSTCESVFAVKTSSHLITMFETTPLNIKAINKIINEIII